MLIGFDLFGLNDGAIINTRLAHPSYNELNITGGVVDDVFVDTNIEIPFSVSKPTEWSYSTAMYAKLQGNLEAGSAEAMGLEIESIRFQKRKWNELEWIDVDELAYQKGDKIVYEVIDKVIANDHIYQYSLLPVTSSVLGNRVLSDEITVDFDGIFLSDGDSNYKLLYNIEYGGINHNTPSTVFQPLNSQYPIVTYSNLDYTDFSVQATFISAHTFTDQNSGDRQVNIRMENVDRNNLLKFIKNKKPKIYRDGKGSLKLVTVIDNPQEMPMNNVNGIANLSFNMVEIGEVNSENLKAYGMINTMDGVV